MKFIQQEGHVLQPDTTMCPAAQLVTDPEMWTVSVYQNKTGICPRYDRSTGVIRHNTSPAHTHPGGPCIFSVILSQRSHPGSSHPVICWEPPVCWSQVERGLIPSWAAWATLESQ